MIIVRRDIHPCAIQLIYPLQIHCRTKPPVLHSCQCCLWFRKTEKSWKGWTCHPEGEKNASENLRNPSIHDKRIFVQLNILSLCGSSLYLFMCKIPDSLLVSAHSTCLKTPQTERWPFHWVCLLLAIEGHFSNSWRAIFFTENTWSNRVIASVKPGATVKEKEVPCCCEINFLQPQV